MNNVSASFGLLLIGSGVLQKTSFGQFVAKSAVAAYVNELAEHFFPLTWVTSVENGPLIFKTPLDSRISICPVGGTRRTFFPDYLLLSRHISKNTVIFIHMPSPWLALSAILLHKKSKGLFTYLAGNFVEHSRISCNSRGRLYSSLYLKLHKMLIRHSNGVIARGVLIKSIAESLNSNVIETIPIGLIASNSIARQFKPCTRPVIRLLYVGKLIAGKGVEVLIEAISVLRKFCPDRSLSVQIVGYGEIRNTLEYQVANKGLQNIVNFLGYIDNPQSLSDLYLQSDILVVPSVYPEGVPRVIDEAIMHGLPVVASAVGGIPLQFKDRVILVPPGNAIALAEGIHRLIEDEVLRNNILESNQKWKLKNAWQTTAAHQHAEFIKRILYKV